MSVLVVFAGDGLAVVEDLCGVRVQACKPPHVPVPKPGPCPGAKRGVKKAADVVKDAVAPGKPAKKTATKTAEPKAPKPTAQPKKTVEPKKAVPKNKRTAPAAPTGGPGTGRDITADSGVDLGSIMSLPKSGPDGSDRRLEALARLQGFDLPPQTGSAAELADAARRGGVSMFRGVEASTDGPVPLSGAQIHELFRTGPVFYGYGQKGNGIYTTVSRADAKSYSDSKPGSVTHMVLKPGARVATRDQLQLMMRAELPDSFAEMEAALEAAQRQWLTPTNSDARRDAARVRMNQLRAQVTGSGDQIYRDLSAFAMAKGYDAVRLPGGTTGRDDNYILLNRSAVLAEEGRR